jgi:hypothetical protein
MPKQVMTHQKMDTVQRGYLVFNIRINLLDDRLEQGDKLVTTLVETIEWLVRCKELIIEGWEEGISPLRLSKFWEVGDSDSVAIQAFGLCLCAVAGDSCRSWNAAFILFLHLDLNRTWDLCSGLLRCRVRNILLLVVVDFNNRSELFDLKFNITECYKVINYSPYFYVRDRVWLSERLHLALLRLLCETWTQDTD